MLMQRLEAKKAIEGSVALKPHNAVQYDIWVSVCLPKSKNRDGSEEHKGLASLGAQNKIQG